MPSLWPWAITGRGISGSFRSERSQPGNAAPDQISLRIHHHVIPAMAQPRYRQEVSTDSRARGSPALAASSTLLADRFFTSRRDEAVPDLPPGVSWPDGRFPWPKLPAPDIRIRRSCTALSLPRSHGYGRSRRRRLHTGPDLFIEIIPPPTPVPG